MKKNESIKDLNKYISKEQLEAKLKEYHKYFEEECDSREDKLDVNNTQEIFNIGQLFGAKYLLETFLEELEEGNFEYSSENKSENDHNKNIIGNRKIFIMDNQEDIAND